MRLIDADALKGQIELRRTAFERIGSIERAEAYANVLWDIVEAPTVGEWVSVKDRLPEKSDKVLVYLDSGIMMDVWYSSKHRKFNSFDENEPNENNFKNVTHWMPLPEPPEGEDHMITFDEAKALIDYALTKITGNIWVFILMTAAIVIAILHAYDRK